MQVKDVLQRTQDFFTKKELPNPRIEAELLLASGLGWERIDLYTRFDYPMTGDEMSRCRQLVQRRLSGEPLAYIIGHQDFYGLRFEVSPAVLIPRPETEQLVDMCIDNLTKVAQIKPALNLADFGSGSGCIGVSLASRFSEARVDCFEKSSKALSILQDNITSHEVSDRCQAILMDLDEITSEALFEAGHWQYDAVIANPPYIASDDELVEASVKNFEPGEALFADDNGLAKIKSWGQLALELLLPQGFLLMELGWKQGDDVQSFFSALDNVAEVSIRKDLSGHDRFAFIKKQGSGLIA